MSRVRIVLAAMAVVGGGALVALAPTTQAQTVDMVGILQTTLDDMRASVPAEQRAELPTEVTYGMLCNYMVLVAGREEEDCPEDPE